MTLHPASSEDCHEAGVRYLKAFPDDCMADWMLPEFMFTKEAVAAMNKAIARGTPVTSAEVDKDYGPFAWDW